MKRAVKKAAQKQACVKLKSPVETKSRIILNPAN
jgi:hypothetical protein